MRKLVGAKRRSRYAGLSRFFESWGFEENRTPPTAGSLRLMIAEGAGHWMGEDAVQEALLKAVREFE